MNCEISIVFLCVGGCVLLWGFILLRRTLRVLKTGTLAEAKVLIATRRDFVVEYETEAGKTMTRTAPDIFRKNAYKVGDDIMVRYVPTRPKEYRIVNMINKNITGEHFLVVIGCVLFFVGLYLVFVHCGSIVS